MKAELENSNTMNNLGHYYQYTEKDYDLVMSYYTQAIELEEVRQFAEEHDKSLIMWDTQVERRYRDFILT